MRVHASNPNAERQMIAALKRRLPAAGAGVRIGIGDDCAVLRPKPGHEIVVTTDLLLEGTHFRRDWHSPESAGHRCLARGLSDLAAMGATPLAAFLSIAVPEELTRPEDRPARGRARGIRNQSQSQSQIWIQRFFDGLLALAAAHRVSLAGGDTAQSPTGGVIADILLLGQTPRGQALLRSKARAGDRIYVTGALGGAAAELLALERGIVGIADRTASGAGQARRNAPRPQLSAHPQLFPAPRLAVGQKLLKHGWAKAAIDISDGLSTDLDHLCEESGLAAELDLGALPVHPQAIEAQRQGWAQSALELALHGGEDYELLFTAPRQLQIPRRIAGVAVHPIGAMRRPQARQPRMVLRDADGSGRALAAGGWEHFRD